MDNFEQVHRYAMAFVKRHFPEIYTEQQDMIEAVTRHIEGYKADPLVQGLAPPVNTTLNLLQSA